MLASRPLEILAAQKNDLATRTRPRPSAPPAEDALAIGSELPRIALVLTHGYLAAQPPLGAADTGPRTTHVLELSRRLALLGYQVDLWTRRFAQQREIEAVTDRVRIIRVPCGGPDFRPKEHLCDHLAEWNEHALQFIARHGLSYRFIHSHYWDAGLATLHLCHVLGVPHVHTPHSLGRGKQRRLAADFPTRTVELEQRHNFARRSEAEQRIYADCDLVILTTPPQLDAILADYEVPAGKARLVPSGYDDQRFFPVGDAQRAALRQRLDYKGKVVLALGPPARKHGHDLLIDAFVVVAKREPKAVLHLAVDGPALGAAEQAALADLKAAAARSGVGDRIRCARLIPDADLPDHLRAADLFVLGSRYEPFGQAAIEAMASGTPTVVTIHGGLHRALSFGRHALFADPFDRDDLGMMMTKIFKYPRLRERLARLGAQQARNFFTWTAVAHQVVAAVEHRLMAGVTLNERDWVERDADVD